MSKSRSVEQTLSGLAALKGVGAGAAGELGKYLGDKTNLVVAKAADLARELGVKSLEAQLVEGFWRFMKNPSSSDKTCAAKQAIANALYELGCDAQEVFLAGIRHVQMEPAWGGAVDTAAELRGICALGLVRMGYREVMNELVDLLADPSQQARIMAARAIAYSGREEGALLLRLKILVGDPSDDVSVDCLLALGNLAKARALPFIAKYLDSSNDALSEAAAMALGEMRHESALAILLEKWERDALPELRKPLTLPIALSRLPRSLDFLVKVVGKAPVSLASAALEALRMYRHDEATRGRIREAVRSRERRDLDGVFETLFG